MISGVNSSIIFEETSFSFNQVSFQLVNIEKTKKIVFLNSKCSNLNNDIISKYTGGCFRTENILKREITNVSIIESNSFSTTAGIKIIDNINSIDNLLLSYHYTDSTNVQKKNLLVI